MLIDSKQTSNSDLITDPKSTSDDLYQQYHSVLTSLLNKHAAVRSLDVRRSHQSHRIRGSRLTYRLPNADAATLREPGASLAHLLTDHDIPSSRICATG